MNHILIIKAVGVVLLGIVLVHYLGMPWGLVAIAGTACVVLP